MTLKKFRDLKIMRKKREALHFKLSNNMLKAKSWKNFRQVKFKFNLDEENRHDGAHH